jgi:predicted lipid-binding transport protein (Tim44 family)
MRKFIVILLMTIVTIGMLINDADARRFGGGRSFGFQRSSSTFSRPSEPARPMFPGANNSQPNRWLGALTGLAAGGLLAYLFMGKGLGSGLLSWLLLAGIAFVVWNVIRNRLRPAAATQPSRENYIQNTISQFTPASTASPFADNKATAYPSDFVPDVFLREAKVQFIRLQAAYDTKNLDDLREFTAPEVFGEIQMQLQERGDTANVTEVVKLDAELLDVIIESHATIASVRFTGLIREEANAAPVSINEIWHLQKKYAGNSTWVVAGLQQQ